MDNQSFNHFITYYLYYLWLLDFSLQKFWLLINIIFFSCGRPDKLCLKKCLTEQTVKLNLWGQKTILSHCCRAFRASQLNCLFWATVYLLCIELVVLVPVHHQTHIDNLSESKFCPAIGMWFCRTMRGFLKLLNRTTLC